MNEHHCKVFQERLKHDCKPRIIPFEYWMKNEKGKHDIMHDNFEFPEEMDEGDFRQKIFIPFNNHVINKYGAEFTLQRLMRLKKVSGEEHMRRDITCSQKIQKEVKIK